MTPKQYEKNKVMLDDASYHFSNVKETCKRIRKILGARTEDEIEEVRRSL